MVDTQVIMGVDPGLANTGWGVIEQRGSKLVPLAYGCITTTSKESLQDRLFDIFTQISDIVERYEPDTVSVESIYFGENVKSAIPTAQARGAMLAAVGLKKVRLGEYTPMQIKKVLVGTGAADKYQVQYMVKAVLGFDHEPKPDHAADALAAAICHARMGEIPSDDARMTRQTRVKDSERDAWTKQFESAGLERKVRQ